MVLPQYKKFLHLFFDELDQKNIDCSAFELDHIAYQAGSSMDYEKVMEEFKSSGKVLSESVVGGRRVGIVELTDPLKYKDYSIGIVEVVEPKAEQNVASHWEHVEMTTSGDLEHFMETYPNLDWDTHAIDRDIFPMLILKLNDTMKVKFPRRGAKIELERQGKL
jgi:predicted metalloenzyme YecM